MRKKKSDTKKNEKKPKEIKRIKNKFWISLGYRSFLFLTFYNEVTYIKQTANYGTIKSENRDEFSTVRDIIDALYKIRPSICSYVRCGAMCIINGNKRKE